MEVLLNPAKRRRRRGGKICLRRRTVARLRRRARGRCGSRRHRRRRLFGAAALWHRTKRLRRSGGLRTSTVSGIGIPSIVQRMRAARFSYLGSAANPRHRRHRRLHRRGRSRSYNYSGVESILGLNAGSMVSSLTAGLKPSTLMDAVPLLAGALGSALVASQVGKLTGTLIPASVKGPATLGLGLVSAGILAMLARMVKPNWAAPVLLGGVAGTAFTAYKTYLEPMVTAALPQTLVPPVSYAQVSSAEGAYVPTAGIADAGLLAGCPGCFGLGDALSPQALARATAISMNGVN